MVVHRLNADDYKDTSWFCKTISYKHSLGMNYIPQIFCSKLPLHINTFLFSSRVLQCHFSHRLHHSLAVMNDFVQQTILRSQVLNFFLSILYIPCTHQTSITNLYFLITPSNIHLSPQHLSSNLYKSSRLSTFISK